MKKTKLLTLLAALVCVTSMGAQNVAKVGETEYASLATAVSNWTNGTTLQLLADIEYAEPITVEGKTVTLDLNGHGIRHTGVEGLFCVVNGGNLTLNDSDPTTEHKFSIGENGFATLDEASGTLTINGGYLTGGIGCNNTAYLRNAQYKDGGAFFLYNGATVTMNGGTLIGNGEAAENRTGGAVFITRDSHFILNGGTITRNRAKFGGGISLYGGRPTADIVDQASSVLEIHGGEISYNYATGNSGGVHTNGYSCKETLIITGGSIINNIVPAGANAAGLIVDNSNTTLYLSGNPVIKDNLRGTDQENIRLNAVTLRINGAMTNTEPVHVFMQNPNVFTSGLSGNGNASNFASDNSGYGVKLNSSGDAVLARMASIDAAPTAVSGLVYTGTAQALINNDGVAQGGTMKYSLDNSTWSASVPTATAVGDYTVYYMVEGDAYHADFIPSPNTVAVTIAAPPAVNITANQDPQHAGVYYSTFYDSSIKYELPAGVEAYVATISDNDLLLTKIAQGGQVIPADNAVIFKANAQNFTLTPSDETPVSFSVVNSLLGTDVAVATPDNCYVLSGHSSDNSVTGVGFYRYNGANLNPHKAYVIFGGSLAPQRMRFIFAEEQTATGTENASADNDESQKRMENGRLVVIKNGVRYNAQGQIVK